MEVRLNVIGKGLYATKEYTKNEIVFVLSGIEFKYPTRESIYVGNNTHVYDESRGIYMNHSFVPTTFIDGYNVVALVDIKIDDELTFNYNENEPKMACPFYVDGKLVCGKTKIIWKFP